MLEIPYLGEALAISAAALWAFAVVLFRRGGEHLDPISLNLFKNAVASLLFLVTLLVFGTDLTPDVPAGDCLRLILSGIIGMAIADTLFLYCLNTLGAGRSQIVSCLYSPFVILLVCIFLGENFGIFDIAGTALILGGILVTSIQGEGDINRANRLKGSLAGALSVALMAVGVVIMKPALGNTSLLFATSLRLITGSLGLAIFTLFLPRRRQIWSSLKFGPHWRYTLPPTLLGTYLAVLIWMAGFKFADASIAAVLNQMSAIFVLPIAAVVLGESLGARKLIAMGLAIGGVLLVILK